MAALGGEEYNTYKSASNNYYVLQQELSELQSIDNKAKTAEQTTREIEIKKKSEQIKAQADNLKNILQNKVAEKIDVDNIRLKDRESYIWESYIKDLPKPTNNTFNGVKTKNRIDENAVVEGMWDTGKSAVNSESAEYVENSGLKLFDNSDKSGIIEKNVKKITLDDLTKDVLKTKPPNSRVPKDWIEAGGSIAIDNKGNWIYTDWFGISVKYINGYPDYKGAGVVVQEVDIGGFISRGIDRRKADKLAPNGPRKKGNVWHHSQDGRTMQEVDEEIHRRFTHKGGYSLRKRKE